MVWETAAYSTGLYTSKKDKNKINVYIIRQAVLFVFLFQINEIWWRFYTSNEHLNLICKMASSVSSDNDVDYDSDVTCGSSDTDDKDQDSYDSGNSSNDDTRDDDESESEEDSDDDDDDDRTG